MTAHNVSPARQTGGVDSSEKQQGGNVPRNPEGPQVVGVAQQSNADPETARAAGPGCIEQTTGQRRRVGEHVVDIALE